MSIKCKICGKDFEVITFSHLRYKHNITVEEYREKFPDADLYSEERNEKISDALEGRDINWKDKISETLSGYRWPEGRNRKISEAHKNTSKPYVSEVMKSDKNPMKKEENQKKISRIAKKRHEKGEPNFGFPSGPEHPYYGGFSDEHKKNLSEGIKKSYENGREPWIKGETKETDERVRKISDALKNRTITDEHFGEILKSAQAEPNNFERNIIKILDENNLPYIYTGSSSLVINGHYPDFANNNGQKKLIEAFGCYWHNCPICGYGNGDIEEIEKERKEIFSDYGFKTLIIWEHELENEKEVVGKIKKFNGGA